MQTESRRETMRNNHPQTALDRSRRFPVWKALSQLYLDTKLQQDDYKQIGTILYSSGFTLAEIKAIHRYEVVPVVGTNLMSAAGVWTGFDDAWLQTQCTKAYEKRSRCAYRWRINVYLFFFGSLFKKVEQTIKAHFLNVRVRSNDSI
ncbi:DUF7079 family protein [Altibacter sp. HG106]|uniref:DUF7079 family protein n=1 Tax=Altibacter sp. HG106 TaxID=3023937 RepID=UPI002350C4CC|nr:hypothetical protein [Altibacter sp. HG106]MDC7995657.1 hypothetical protein [Altibacter sp. HG106]